MTLIFFNTFGRKMMMFSQTSTKSAGATGVRNITPQARKTAPYPRQPRQVTPTYAPSCPSPAAEPS